MRKFNLKYGIAALLCSGLLFSSCIGSFGLHGRLVEWNQGIGAKFVNELVFFAFHIVPVYEVAYLADILVVNSIEFWSGDNPMASIGDVKKVKGENGNYLVETTETGYTITKEGEDMTMELVYDRDLRAWSVLADGISVELIRFGEDGVTAQMPAARGGDPLTVTLDEMGVETARRAYGLGTYYALAR